MMSLFRGRTDAFSKRSGKPNAKTGKIGYYTQCMNYGKRGICPKYSGISIKCQDCAINNIRLCSQTLLKHI